MIELNQLTRRFGSTVAVDAVTLSIPAGQICGYLGPNGAGKTTTVKMLTGLIQPSGGTAKVAGFDIKQDSIEVKRRLGYVPESGALYQSLTPFEYLSFIGSLYGMDEQEIVQKVNDFMEFFQISGNMHEPMTTFSKGMKQKVVISSAFIHNPEVVFLDEPLNGLDANAALLLKELLRNLANSGKTIFYCSHILEVVENLCDRVVILEKGRVVADDSVKNLKEMTKESSLEAVFSKLTHAEAMGDIAKAFSKSMISGKPREK